MASWKKTITSQFKKACTFFNQQPRDKKSQRGTYFVGAGHENRVMDLHGEVQACAYEDVQVMWSILDKSKSTACHINS
ncbi:hypothetical protein QQP08_013260 [Theobroma cacao]|uniref:Uncharacterized protein LOC18603790 n=1 Tax=Theobroma cacao TaxID=3641 RepID=A0AB32W9A3_THECC|nr:PREDICTED: uncharacterized protein LOC18603790 [Theobroma cacao]WRX20773.1 hypothetical protein QQP08_013260 [Theobroma cacao]